MTVDLWASGELQQDLHYRVMVGDGFNTFSLRGAELDANLAYSGSVWWEPYGSFSPGFAGLEYHDMLAVRLGQRLTYTRIDGAISETSLFDHGYFVQGGVFAVLERLKLFAIGSQVIDEFGTGNQVSAGFNWYFQDKRGSRFTIDATYLDDAPVQQSRTGYVAGPTGTLIRAQP